MQLYLAVQNVFGQLAGSLCQLQPEEYTQPSETLSGHTIGQHVRHIIELYQSLENGYEQGLVNYEKRKRDKAIENDSELACRLLEQILSGLARPDKPLLLEVGYGDCPAEPSESSKPAGPPGSPKPSGPSDLSGSSEPVEPAGPSASSGSSRPSESSAPTGLSGSSGPTNPAGPSVPINTNYYREVAYNLEHTIHHMALIRIGIRDTGNHLVLPEGYGIAPSTLQYRRKCAQ